MDGNESLSIDDGYMLFRQEGLFTENMELMRDIRRQGKLCDVTIIIEVGSLFPLIQLNDQGRMKALDKRAGDLTEHWENVWKSKQGNKIIKFSFKIKALGRFTRNNIKLYSRTTHSRPIA